MSGLPTVCMDSPRETWPAGASHTLCALHMIARADIGSFFVNEREAMRELNKAIQGLTREGKHVAACIDLDTAFSVEWVPDAERIADVQSMDELRDDEWREVTHDAFRQRLLEWFFEVRRALEPDEARRILEDLIEEAEG